MYYIHVFFQNYANFYENYLRLLIKIFRNDFWSK